LLLQKRELEKRLKENYVERETRIKDIKSDLIKVIIGPRRAGKSFYAIHELRKIGAFGYVNFDDEKLADTEDYDEITAAIDSIYSSPQLLLFDEIQNLPRWELYVNRLQRQGYNLMITGSNSRLLSRELATHLTGRHTQATILPFSFRETIKNEGKDLTRAETKEKLLQYLTYGGYPEPAVKKLDYDNYLSTLFDSIIYKDVVKRYRIRSPQAMDDLARYLLTNITKEFSYTALAKITRCKSTHTIEKYLGYLEESYLFFRLNRFSYKVKEQISSNKKIYCIDNGFVHAKAYRTSPDAGRLYENIVAIELKRLEEDGLIETYYWKNTQQEEVDFVVKKGHEVKQLIQVCYDAAETETKKREERALLKAGEELRCNDLLTITGDYEAEEEAEWFGTKGRIRYLPLWKWLLEEKT